MNITRFKDDVAPIPFSAVNQVGLWLDPAFTERRIQTANRHFLTGRLPFAFFLVRRAADKVYGNGARYDASYHPTEILRLSSSLASLSWRKSRC